jgi:hypothetical protein
MDEEIFIPITFFAMIGAVVWAVQAYGGKYRADLLKTVRAAIDRGTELSPETIKALGAPRRSRYGDVKWGAIWIAISAACVVFGWAVSDVAEADFETMRIFTGIAAFPGFIGLALLGYGLAMLRAKE